jgi:hypothetical protein
MYSDTKGRMQIFMWVRACVFHNWFYLLVNAVFERNMSANDHWCSTLVEKYIPKIGKDICTLNIYDDTIDSVSRVAQSV